ncbi:ATP-binding cassette domain-containing protein [Texas Phoenix palm phytoplasma]|uniref:ATP-binding cassette domain-containing protein n=1 Tax=Texas Phoenix palm phytoplasma TaxID=176709 RepID=A0ABS5BJ85_9MOLU|nr:ABC transporter ATP-binding protein [Texas Phoenix palm phytoplasma]MBP3059254.1 ATP-binding cassette domain-containing protein [Texas Phoenix palm phytoplasma]
MNKIFYYLKPFKKKLIISIIFLLIWSIVISFIPLFEGKYVIDFIKKNSSVLSNLEFHDYLKHIILFLFINFILYLCCTLCKFTYNSLLISSVHKAIKNIRNDLFKKIHKLPIEYFDKNTIGGVISNLTDDVEVFSNGMQQTCASLISSFLSLFVLVCLMFWVNFRLGIVVFLIIPLSLMTIFFINKKSSNIFIERFNTTGEYNGFLQEKYTGHREILLFNQQEKVIEEFELVNKKLSKLIFKSNFLSGLSVPIVNSFTYIILTFMIILGYYLINPDLLQKSKILVKLGFIPIQLGIFQAFIQYVWRVGNPINDLSQIFVILQSTKAAFRKICIFLNEKEEELEKEFLNLQKIEGSVVFSNVFFGYQKNKPIIKNMNLVVQNNQMVAIVGPTGSGKTTLINLLTRFYDVQSGSITIDGIDIRALKKSQLRQILGIVFQDFWLFKGTILDNIRYGDFNKTEQQVIEVAKKLQIHEFIMSKENGYYTVVEEESDILSQGEKQLITIARTLLRNPNILILDEATSTIDTTMESLIQKSIKKLLQKRTSFVIAHRLSTIVNADIILVFNDGVIVEKGNHYELIEKKGFYYNLYQSQFSK